MFGFVGDLIPLRRRRLPAMWAPYLRPRGVPAAQIRLAVWSGMLIGLLAYQATRLLPSPAPAPVAAIIEAADPYAEARLSRAILEAQEGPPRPLPSEGRARSHPAEVRVIDGDTFYYDSMRVRIADIDAPEVNGRCPHETELAARATERMRALLAAGPFELHPLVNGRDQDRYGRKLRIVTRGGRSLGDMLVAEGLARTWTGRREPWCT